MTFETFNIIMRELEQNYCIQTFFDSGLCLQLGDPANGFTAAYTTQSFELLNQIFDQIVENLRKAK